MGHIALELKVATERDRAVWDAAVCQDPGGSIFHTWAWLTTTAAFSVKRILGRPCRAELHPLMVYRGQELVALYPVFVYRHPLLVAAVSGSYDDQMMYLGPVTPAARLMRNRKRESLGFELQDLCDAYLRETLHCRCIVVRHTPWSCADSRPWLRNGYTVIPAHTYVFDLAFGSAVIWEGFGKEIRQNVRILEKRGVEVDNGDISDFAAIHRQLGNRGRMGVPFSFFETLSRVLPPEQLQFLVLRDGGTPVGGTSLLVWQGRMHLWVGFPAVPGSVRVNDLLLWRSIERAEEMGCRLVENMGADDETTIRFKKRFNPSLVPYMTYRWDAPAIRLGRSAAQFLREVRG
ncbi:MAG: GNAT family N-acetyltransferase [Methanomicrobiaceae archaeon]|nr:GNAT family N-acetyltransferase [Methanomicrobiaceae archaeon]